MKKTKKEVKMEMTVRNFVWHVESLAHAFDVNLVFDQAMVRHSGNALTLLNKETKVIVAKVVRTRPIDDETSYAVAMHEMGHHLAPNGLCLAKPPGLFSHPREKYDFLRAKLVSEYAAWEWAQYYIEQVFIWTVAMEQVKQYGLSTYELFQLYKEQR